MRGVDVDQFIGGLIMDVLGNEHKFRPDKIGNKAFSEALGKLPETVGRQVDRARAELAAETPRTAEDVLAEEAQHQAWIERQVARDAAPLPGSDPTPALPAHMSRHAWGDRAPSPVSRS